MWRPVDAQVIVRHGSRPRRSRRRRPCPSDARGPSHRARRPPPRDPALWPPCPAALPRRIATRATRKQGRMPRRWPRRTARRDGGWRSSAAGACWRSAASPWASRRSARKRRKAAERDGRTPEGHDRIAGKNPNSIARLAADPLSGRSRPRRGIRGRRAARRRHRDPRPQERLLLGRTPASS